MLIIENLPEKDADETIEEMLTAAHLDQDGWSLLRLQSTLHWLFTVKSKVLALWKTQE